jgi:hypothetical protein
MEAATWTAIALLAATSLGRLFYLGCTIDVLSAGIDARPRGSMNSPPRWKNHAG